MDLSKIALLNPDSAPKRKRPMVAPGPEMFKEVPKRKRPMVAPTASVAEPIATKPEAPKLKKSKEIEEFDDTIAFLKAKKDKEEDRKKQQEKILDEVKKIATEMAQKAKEQGVRGNKPYKGRIDDIRKIKHLYAEWFKSGGREPSYFTSALEPYTTEGARYGARTFKYKKDELDEESHESYMNRRHGRNID